MRKNNDTLRYLSRFWKYERVESSVLWKLQQGDGFYRPKLTKKEMKKMVLGWEFGRVLVGSCGI